jgi:MFS family permease
MNATPSSGAPLRQRPFALFWCARVAADLALQIQVVAVGWQVYALTDSPLSLGLVGLVQFVPALMFLLFAGHVADRHDRARVVRLSQIAEAAALAVLALATAAGAMSRDLILAMVFVIGAARSFEVPAIQSLLATIVPPALFPRAVAASTAGVQAARIVGPATGAGVFTRPRPTANISGAEISQHSSTPTTSSRCAILLFEGGIDALPVPR